MVWVGYDDNTEMGLTGASAALPIWTELTKSLGHIYQSTPPQWPEGVEPRKIHRDQLLRDFPTLKDLPEEIELTFPGWAS
ncbi:MAG: hypothetical protein HC902_11940 [Calothrix sp. SM1_5_4]|nr:hypothetical protein [Calothrix sp. SM1_5_4]